jgi:hypothetical protein
VAWDSPFAGGRPAPPRVNLLPGELEERRLLRRQRGLVGAGGAVLLALLGLWYLLQASGLDQARRDADKQQAVVVGLRAQQAQLQPYADLQAQIAAAEQLRTQVYAKEIRFSGVLQDVAAIVPGNVWLTQMTITPKSATGTTGGSAPTPGGGPQATVTPGSPGAGSPVAGITFSGSGLGHVDVGGFLRALARGPEKHGQRVYLNPYFTSSQESSSSGGQATVSFSATVDMSQAAYSGRYQPGAGGSP